MTVVDAVSGKAKLAGLEWLLFGPEPQRVLLQTLGAVLDDPSHLRSCRLRRVRFKPGHKLTAHYDLVLQSGISRPIAVVWRSHRSAGWRKVQSQIDGIHAELAGRGLLTPFRALAAESREWNLRVQVAPLDAHLPQLARLFDPPYFFEKLYDASSASVQADREPAHRLSQVRFVRYQPGLRHVLRFDPVKPTASAAIFAKLSTRNASERAFHGALQLHNWLETGRASINSVHPLGCDVADSLVFYPEVVGPPLSEILRRPNQDLMGRLRRAGEALNLLHGLPESLARGFELRDFAQEMEEIAQASGFVKTLLAEEGALIEALLESAREANGRLEQAPPTFIHGDLKLEHLLVTETGMALIDFDTCGRGDPALDAGTFLADLRLWYAVYHQPGLEKAQGKFLEGYAPGAPAAWLVRARLYEAIELVKMAARRLPLFDEHWPALMESLVRDARRVMEGVEADLGLVAQNPGSTGAVHFSPPILDPRAASQPASKIFVKGTRNS